MNERVYVIPVQDVLNGLVLPEVLVRRYEVISEYLVELPFLGGVPVVFHVYKFSCVHDQLRYLRSHKFYSCFLRPLRTWPGRQGQTRGPRLADVHLYCRRVNEQTECATSIPAVFNPRGCCDNCMACLKTRSAAIIQKNVYQLARLTGPARINHNTTRTQLQRYIPRSALCQRKSVYHYNRRLIRTGIA